jgi:hypothetical protein
MEEKGSAPLLAMRSEKEHILRVGQFANLVIGGAAVFCVGTLLYSIYYYSWTHERYFTSTIGPVLYYLLPAALAGLLLASLWLEPSSRINLSFLLVSTGVSIYAIELLLAFLSIDERVKIAKEFGVAFDTRSKLEVIVDLAKQHISAVPNIFSIGLFKKQTDGTVKSELTINGTETLPLGAIANRTTVFCNENGDYVIYESDEHGFHNPKGIWDAGRVDIAVVGDSFAEGFCVPSEKNFVALIRKHYPATLNLGKTGNGPLTELATLKEYLPSLKPKVVLWFYYERNDLTDLKFEKDSPLLMSYLRDNFTQGLLNQQVSIDQALTTYYVKTQRSTETQKRLEAGTAIIKLTHLRSRLGLDFGDYEHGRETVSDSDLGLFGQILSEAKALVGTWGGTLYFVYLPYRERYANPEIDNKIDNKNSDQALSLVLEKVRYQDRVLGVARTIEIPVIDIHPVFQTHGDPLALFPFRRSVHYNEEGHRLVAEEVLHSISLGN